MAQMDKDTAVRALDQSLEILAQPENEQALDAIVQEVEAQPEQQRPMYGCDGLVRVRVLLCSVCMSVSTAFLPCEPPAIMHCVHVPHSH